MTTGIHHITAIASNASKNFRFYTHTLGLRLVKKTVNQDDTSTYHLFYGDKLGHPGMDLTFFIFQPATQGRRGNGLVTNISLSVPEKSLEFWQDRFKKLHVKHTGISEVLGKKRLLFFDEDNQQLELVGVTETHLDSQDIWTTEEISKTHAIRNFHSATLSIHDLSQMEPILRHVFGYTEKEKDGNTYLFEVKDSHRANILEVIESEHVEPGFNAAGTVHHIAFRAKDSAEQLAMAAKVIELGLSPTHVIDRFYFKSVYFRTPSGILFEIATDGPGFTADEAEDALGEKLSLPPFLEGERTWIEENLPPVETNN